MSFPTTPTFPSRSMSQDDFNAAMDALFVWFNDLQAWADSPGTPINGAGGNRLINGGFRVNQRVPSSVSNGAYTLDRWFALTQSGAIGVAQQAAQENAQPTNIRLTQSQVSAQRFGLAQVIESPNCQDLRGSECTLAGRVRISASGQLIRYAIIEWDGAVDGITRANLVNSWTSTTFTSGNFFLAGCTAAVGSITPAANTWTALPDLNATPGPSTSNLIVFVWTDQPQAQSVTLDLGLMQLEAGANSTTFQRRQYSEELAMCMRYYENSFLPGVAPAQSVAQVGFTAAQSGGAGASQHIGFCQFKVIKRASPTITLFNPAAANAQMHDYSAGTDWTSSTAGANTRGFDLSGTSPGGSTGGDQMGINWQADAEI